MSCKGFKQGDLGIDLGIVRPRPPRSAEVADCGIARVSSGILLPVIGKVDFGKGDNAEVFGGFSFQFTKKQLGPLPQMRELTAPVRVLELTLLDPSECSRRTDVAFLFGKAEAGMEAGYGGALLVAVMH